MENLKNKVIFVTGGASGIGQATAILAAKKGAKVAIADLASADYHKTLEEIEKAGSEGFFTPVDVGQSTSVKTAIDETVQHFGRVDIVVNNAGIAGELGALADISEEGFAKTIQINLMGVFYGIKHAVPHMEKQGGGAIINIASILGSVAATGTGAYTASKHAVVGLTKSGALDYAAKNIRINAVGPGYIDTPLLRALDTEALKGIVKLHPVGRLGKAEEIASMVLWLASDEASFATGGYYPVDGGYLAQ